MNLSDDTQERLAEIHEQSKELGRNGKAIDLEPDRKGRYSVIYWDEKTGQWLYGNDATELGWVMIPREEFPYGLEIMISWGEYETVPIEDTRLWHGTYGLDQARDGYGV